MEGSGEHYQRWSDNGGQTTRGSSTNSYSTGFIADLFLVIILVMHGTDGAGVPLFLLPSIISRAVRYASLC
jgi:hypothetical protein